MNKRRNIPHVRDISSGSPGQDGASMRIVIEIEGANPPVGKVNAYWPASAHSPGPAASASFEGWLGLMHALSLALGRDQSEETRTPMPPPA
jgi:hypothetical protein